MAVVIRVERTVLSSSKKLSDLERSAAVSSSTSRSAFRIEIAAAGLRHSRAPSDKTNAMIQPAQLQPHASADGFWFARQAA
jgi:hypothetical protein